MSDLARLERGLRAVLWELSDYLPDLVLIGGWVPHLHRRYGPFPEWRGNLSLTAELDLLVERRLPGVIALPSPKSWWRHPSNRHRVPPRTPYGRGRPVPAR